MAKAFKLTAANVKVLQTQLGAGVTCGRAENALKDMTARVEATDNAAFIAKHNALLATMKQEMAAAELALGKYRAAAVAMLMLHADEDK